jgi:hypothetical protein
MLAQELHGTANLQNLFILRKWNFIPIEQLQISTYPQLWKITILPIVLWFDYFRDLI